MNKTVCCSEKGLIMKAKLTLDKNYKIGEVDDRLFGSFVEHLGRAVYGGIYEPDHPTADKEGFRQDVLDLVRELKVPVVRYPGGNFVSAYNWEDGVGPLDQRPKRLDLAWKSLEPNLVGLNEFSSWCKKADTKLMMAINLGSRGIDAARNILEYANHEKGTYWSDLRRSHGIKDPHNIKMWCLGNEMDGPWQVGHKEAKEYGRLADETAKAMKYYDKDLELIVAGSSNGRMKTFPDWENEVLSECYDNVDYLSLHNYIGNRTNDLSSFLAANLELDHFIDSVVSTCDFVKAKKRSKKQINLSFDEWNVWYHSNQQDQDLYDRTPWQVGPPLLEDIYNFEDALVVGGQLNSLIRHADRVKIGCLAQLVNVIAPIMTDNGGSAWRQTIFYPFMQASLYGRGVSMKLICESEGYEDDHVGFTPWLDASAVWNEESEEISLFLLNRNKDTPLEIEGLMGGFTGFKPVEHVTMVNSDIKAVNTAKNPDNVVPVQLKNTLSVEGEKMSLQIPPLSWNLVRLKKA
jgi:alpha-N-arabinofuranosidase